MKDDGQACQLPGADRNALSDCNARGDLIGTDVNPFGSNPVAPIIFQEKAFRQQVEVLSDCAD
jgi:hypothetical protein